MRTDSSFVEPQSLVHYQGSCIHSQGACIHTQGACIHSQGACIHSQLVTQLWCESFLVVLVFLESGWALGRKLMLLVSLLEIGRPLISSLGVKRWPEELFKAHGMALARFCLLIHVWALCSQALARLRRWYCSQELVRLRRWYCSQELVRLRRC